MSLETNIEELTKAVVALTEAMNKEEVIAVEYDTSAGVQAETQPAADEAPVVEVSPEKKKATKKKKKKAAKKSAAESLLDDEPVEERQEVIEEVTSEVTVTMDELLAEAGRNVSLLEDDTFLREVLEGYGYAKFSDITDENLATIFNKIKAKNDE